MPNNDFYNVLRLFCMLLKTTDKIVLLLPPPEITIYRLDQFLNPKKYSKKTIHNEVNIFQF